MDSGELGFWSRILSKGARHQLFFLAFLCAKWTVGWISLMKEKTKWAVKHFLGSMLYGLAVQSRSGCPVLGMPCPQSRRRGGNRLLVFCVLWVCPGVICWWALAFVVLKGSKMDQLLPNCCPGMVLDGKIWVERLWVRSCTLSAPRLKLLSYDSLAGGLSGLNAGDHVSSNITATASRWMSGCILAVRQGAFSLWGFVVW